MRVVCLVTRSDDYLMHADRMKKNHKWVDRKRGPDGKWIYDYGDGFPGEKRKKKFKNVRPDSNDFVRFGGHKVYKAEDNTAYIRNKGGNPYKAYTYGRTAGEAARKYNSELQKRQHWIRMPDGGRYVY